MLLAVAVGCAAAPRPHGEVGGQTVFHIGGRIAGAEYPDRFAKWFAVRDGRPDGGWTNESRAADLGALAARPGTATIVAEQRDRASDGDGADRRDAAASRIERRDRTREPDAAPADAPTPREVVTAIVTRIRRADYEGDRSELRRLHAELARYATDRGLMTWVLYWRGFALWRSALNGFGESADPQAIGKDLAQCIVDFREALRTDPDLVDAKVGAASCLANHAFLTMAVDRARAGELLTQSTELLREASAAAPDNPRLLWVLGANQWYAPPERGGGEDAAMATYHRGLAAARRAKRTVVDPLLPTWGEAELLMNLAFANLHRKTPDLTAAEQYAESALELVANWRYVRDTLLPQIRDAMRRERASSAP
jgi:hypothetical protein